MTRALVTGATGFIGSALVPRLLADGFRVSCLVRRDSDTARLLAQPEVDVIRIGSPGTTALEQALQHVRADVVIHLAAYGVDPRDRDPQIAVDANIGLLTRLLRISAGWSLRRFVHVGSSSEYGVPPAGTPVDEETPLRPTALYGAAKGAAATIGTIVARDLNTPFVVLRLFSVFGVGEKPDRLAPYLIDRLARDQRADLTPGEQVRDFLHVDDVIDALVHAARSDTIGARTVYNVCSGRGVTVRSVGETIADLMGKPRSLLGWGDRPYRPDEPMWLVGDNRRFLAATAWRPRVSLVTGLARMVTARTRVATSGGA